MASRTVVAERISTAAETPAEAGAAAAAAPVGGGVQHQDGELPRSDPNEMPASGFDPRFDTTKPTAGQEGGDGGEIQPEEGVAAAAAGGAVPATTPPEAASRHRVPRPAAGVSAQGGGLGVVQAAAGPAWIPESALKMSGRSKGKASDLAAYTVGVASWDAGEAGGGKRTVAMRRIRAGLLTDTAAADLASETLAASRMRHPCLAETYGIGCSSDGTVARGTNSSANGASGSSSSSGLSPFVVGQHLPHALTLHELLTRQMEAPYRRLYGEEDALRWGLQVARALRGMHEQSPTAVHRDVRPDNCVLLTSKRGGHAGDADCLLTGQGMHTLLEHTVDVPVALAYQRMALKRGSSRASGDPTASDRFNMVGPAADGRDRAPGSPAAVGHSSGLDGKAIRANFNAASDLVLYMAPEVFRGEQYNDRADVYGFGLVLYELLTRESTYYAARSRDQVGDVYSYMEHVALQGERPVIPNRIPGALAGLIKRCWQANPSARPPMSQVVQILKTYMEERAIPEKAAARGSFQDGAATCGCGPAAGAACVVM